MGAWDWAFSASSVALFWCLMALDCSPAALAEFLAEASCCFWTLR